MPGKLVMLFLSFLKINLNTDQAGEEWYSQTCKLHHFRIWVCAYLCERGKYQLASLEEIRTEKEKPDPIGRMGNCSKSNPWDYYYR